jgi:hypothetical protein
MDTHIGESVWRSSMAGGDPNPEVTRKIIDKPPMFSYPTKQTPDPNEDKENHGMKEEEAVGAKIDPNVVKASSEKAAKEAEAE